MLVTFHVAFITVTSFTTTFDALFLTAFAVLLLCGCAFMRIFFSHSLLGTVTAVCAFWELQRT